MRKAQRALVCQPHGVNLEETFRHHLRWRTKRTAVAILPRETWSRLRTAVGRRATMATCWIWTEALARGVGGWCDTVFENLFTLVHLFCSITFAFHTQSQELFHTAAPNNKVCRRQSPARRRARRSPRTITRRDCASQSCFTGVWVG